MCKHCELEDYFIDKFHIGDCRDCGICLCFFCGEIILYAGKYGLTNDNNEIISLNDIICGNHLKNCKKDNPLIITKYENTICNFYCNECYDKL